MNRTRFGCVVALSVVSATACVSRDKPKPPKGTSPSLSAESGPSAGLLDFWKGTDVSVHDAQRSLRSARQIAKQIGGQATKDDYQPIIALGHRLGGLGHDHAAPAANVPVISMLDSMIASIEELIQSASTSAEVEVAQSATDASVSQLSPSTQRLYHLLSAKRKLSSVRERANAIGFRPAP